MSDLKYNFDDNLNLLRVASEDLSVLRERLACEFSGFEGVVANPHLLLSQIAALQGRMEEVSCLLEDVMHVSLPPLPFSSLTTVASSFLFPVSVPTSHLPRHRETSTSPLLSQLSSSAESLLASRTSLVSSSLSSSLSLSVAVSSLCRELKLDDGEGVGEGKSKGKATGGGVNNAFPKHLIEPEGDENEEPKKFGAMGATELQWVAEQELQLWNKLGSKF